MHTIKANTKSTNDRDVFVDDYEQSVEKELSLVGYHAAVLDHVISRQKYIVSLRMMR